MEWMTRLFDAFTWFPTLGTAAVFAGWGGLTLFACLAHFLRGGRRRGR